MRVSAWNSNFSELLFLSLKLSSTLGLVVKFLMDEPIINYFIIINNLLSLNYVLSIILFSYLKQMQHYEA